MGRVADGILHPPAQGGLVSGGTAGPDVDLAAPETALKPAFHPRVGTSEPRSARPLGRARVPGWTSVRTGRWRNRPRGQCPEPGPSAPRRSPCHSPAPLQPAPVGSLLGVRSGWRMEGRGIPCLDPWSEQLRAGPCCPSALAGSERKGSVSPTLGLVGSFLGYRPPAPGAVPPGHSPAPCMEVLLGGLQKARRGQAAEAGRTPTAP